MITYALWFACACFGVALLINLYRAVVAPVVVDRVLALDTMTVNVIALLTLFGMIRGTGIYFETTLLFAMMGFVGSVAYARFVLRGDVIE